MRSFSLKCKSGEEEALEFFFSFFVRESWEDGAAAAAAVVAAAAAAACLERGRVAQCKAGMETSSALHNVTNVSPDETSVSPPKKCRKIFP